MGNCKCIITTYQLVMSCPRHHSWGQKQKPPKEGQCRQNDSQLNEFLTKKLYQCPQITGAMNFMKKNYLARGVVLKINLLSVKTYRIHTPPPIPFITVARHFACTTEFISITFIRRKKNITARKLNCQVINYCAPGHTGNMRQKQAFSISKPVHCCKGKNKSFLPKCSEKGF